MNTTSELDAINSILAAIGEAPINSLDADLPVAAAVAKNTLAEISREVQSRGWWFNTEYDAVLPRSGDTTISLQPNTLAVEFDESTRFDFDPIQRGPKLYDRKSRSATFTKDLTASRLVLGLPFEELPEVARRFITVRAARITHDRTIGEQQMHTFTAIAEQQAYQALVRESVRQDQPNMLKSPFVSRIARRIPWR
jgi:hypothetical protein